MLNSVVTVSLPQSRISVSLKLMYSHYKEKNMERSLNQYPIEAYWLHPISLRTPTPVSLYWH